MKTISLRILLTLLLSKNLYASSDKQVLKLEDEENPRHQQSKSLMALDSSLLSEQDTATDLQAGFKWWGQQKQYVLDFLQKTVPSRTVLGALLPNAQDVKTYFQRGFGQRIEGLFNIGTQPVDIVISGGMHGLITFHLFKSLAVTLQSLSESLSQNFEKAKYTRSDLEVLKNHTKEALLVSTYIDNLFSCYYNSETKPFVQETFEEGLPKLPYIPAQKANTLIPFLQVSTLLQGNEMDGFAYLWWINREFKIYMNNFHYMLGKHLKSGDPALKRSNLTTSLVSSLEALSLADFEEQAKKLLSDNGITGKKKKKHKKKKHKKKKKKDVASPTESMIFVSQEERQSLKSTFVDSLKEVVEIDSQQEAVATVKSLSFQQQNAIKQPVKDPIKEDDVRSETTMKLPLELLEEDLNGEVEKKEIEEQNLQNVKQPSPEELRIGKAHQDLEKVRLILDQQGGKIKGGTKSRDFVATMTALNKLGYFKEFMADQKQVKVTLPKNTALPNGHAATFHLNHSNKRKDTGLSYTTAREANKFVEALESSVISQSQQMPKEN